MTQIVRWIPENENWEVLKEFNTYNEADQEYDAYVNLYPNAWIEILDEEDQDAEV